MARKSVEPEYTQMADPQQGDDDIIVLRRSWVVTFFVGVIAFLLGGLFFTFLGFIYNGGLLVKTGGSAAQVAPQGPVAPTDTPRVDNVGLGTMPVLGSESAPVTIVEFSDFQCPFCKRFKDQTMDALRQKYGDKVKIYFRHFPLESIHPEARNGSEAALCANEQGKFWEMHDELFLTQDLISPDNSKSLAEKLGLNKEQFDTCLDSSKYDSVINTDLQDGASYGVSGTPTFFIDGWRLVGAQPLAQFSAIIDKELGQ
jgi:protein-disulfide isomerase